MANPNPLPSSSSLEQLLLDPQLTEKALHELSKRKDIFQELAPLLWHHLFASSEGYSFQKHQASQMRQTSLEVIRELVKAKDKEVIRYLIATETVPICFHAIDYGTDLSKTVGTFIIQKKLEDDLGLEYIGNSEERFFSLNARLTVMVAEIPSPELVKIIIRCYPRLTDNHIYILITSRARHALETCLPMRLTNTTLTACLYDDQLTMQCLQQLLQIVGFFRRPPH